MARDNAWTQEEEAWLRENYPNYVSRVLARMHAEAFPDGPARTESAIKAKGQKLRISKCDGFVRRETVFWTPERVEWFKEFVPGHEEREISAEHERIFGTPLSEAQIGNAKAKYGVKSGTKGGCFKKGFTPHNKGKTWDELGHTEEAKANMRTTQFKKGEIHDRRDGWIKPKGYERISVDGYVEVKVRDSFVDGVQEKANKNYRMKHHIVWEQHHGPIPPSTVITFADHDKRNFDIDNLVAVPRSLWSTIQRLGFPYSDAESLMAVMNIARLMQAKNGAKRRLKEKKKAAEGSS